MLEAYRHHAAERAALGIPPLPLSAQQTAQVIELLKNPPAGEEQFLVDLITNRVPAGVDDGAKGPPPKVAGKLRAAFKTAAASPEFTEACARIDAPVMYLDGPEYAQYVSAVYEKETQLIERLKLKELLAKN